ncbi:MAG: adenosine kinase [Pseudomonadota bacterium]|nr:adenosine kinase [Pseudomonadota bacterium]
MSFDAVGLGNAIMDALVRVDDSVIAELGLTRGQMHPVNHDTWHAAYERVSQLGIQVYSGGSCANTVQTLGLLGGRVLYCGQIGDDQYGEMYTRSMLEVCGVHALKTTNLHATGKCLSLISAADGERTMLTDLGAAVHLPTIGDFAEHVRKAKVLHLTGYLFLGGPVRDAAFEAVEVARAAGVPISLDVADPFVARTIPHDIVDLLKNYVDICFLNREEAEIITELEPERAVELLGSWCTSAVVKLGGAGSLVRQDGVTHRIPVFPVKVADTTGAGDAYAGGFLYGWLHGWPAERCGELGSRVAALTVGQVGAVCRDRDAVAAARSLVVDR